MLLGTAFAKEEKKSDGSKNPSLNYYTLSWPKEPLPDNFHKLIILNVSPYELGEKYTTFLTHSLMTKHRCFYSDKDMEKTIESFAGEALVANPLTSSGAQSLPYLTDPKTDAYIPTWLTSRNFEVLDRKQLQANIKEVTRSADTRSIRNRSCVSVSSPKPTASSA